MRFENSGPDRRIAEITTRNTRAIAEATATPPPHIADDPRAYLAWRQQPPETRPTVSRPPTPSRPVAIRAAGPWRPAARRSTPQTSPAPQLLNAARNAQLDALERFIAAERDQP